MNEQIRVLAEQAGMENGFPTNGVYTLYGLADIEKFAELVAAAEREAILELRNHEDVMAPVGQSAWGEAYQDGWIAGVQEYVDQIRARNQ